MAETAPTTYDEVSYPSYPFAQTHPDRLATLATLFGVTPAPIDRCRVLELGCGDGSNILPMALILPNSRFVGVDLAAQPIARGRATVEALELANITLQQADIMQLSPEFGQFDYIIAHGLYSWVPAALRDRLLAICKANLAPNGVAYVSYNAYPGGHLRDMLRDMMLYHVKDVVEPAAQLRQSRALTRFLAASASSSSGLAASDLYKLILASFEQEVGRLDDGFLFHDHLSTVNSSFYFHQFIDHASQHGLRYLAEADFFDMQCETLAPEAAERLHQIGERDIIAKEQYLDFLTGRKFRQTLLCHAEVTIDRQVRPERLANLFVASSVRPRSTNPTIESSAVEVFQSSDAALMSTKMSTNHPLTKAALLQLGGLWPQSMHFQELLTAARREVLANTARHNGHSVLESTGDEVRDDAELLGEFLLKAYAANLIELHVHPAEFVPRAGERPTASRLARRQLKSGPTVTTLRHTNVQVQDALGQELLRLLDGNHDRQALLDELSKRVASGAVVLHRGGKQIIDTGEAQQILAAELEQNLNKIAQLALLVA